MTLQLDESLSADVVAQAALTGVNPELLLAQIVRASLPKADEALQQSRRVAIERIKELRKGRFVDLNGQSMNKWIHEDHKY